jgi:hypothetical protein
MGPGQSIARGPKQPKKIYPYNESVDESAKLIEQEPTDIEGELPADANEPIQSVKDADEAEPPVFEE